MSEDKTRVQLDLAVTLRDAAGVVVEEFIAPASEAVARASTFMILHGTDPDEHGAAAAPGRIDFRPAT
jgi:hypothetical protein